MSEMDGGIVFFRCHVVATSNGRLSIKSKHHFLPLFPGGNNLKIVVKHKNTRLV